MKTEQGEVTEVYRGKYGDEKYLRNRMKVHYACNGFDFYEEFNQ